MAEGPVCPVCRAGATQPLMQVGDQDYHFCQDCQARFLEPDQRMALEQERQVYRHHQNAEDDTGYRDFLSRLVTPLVDKLSSPMEGLDYGCGPGPVLAAMLQEAGHAMTLYDPAFHPDRAALTRTYDFIACSEVAEHFHHPADEFDRLGQCLKPGGWLAVMTCFQTDDSRFADWHYRRDPTHVVFYRKATFHALAAQRGWHCEIPVKNVALLQIP